MKFKSLKTILLLLLILLATIISRGQTSVFSFPRHNATTKGLDLQLETFIDQFGKPPNGANGGQMGIMERMLVNYTHKNQQV